MNDPNDIEKEMMDYIRDTGYTHDPEDDRIDLIELYERYGTTKNDSPQEFHLLTGYWLVSAILGKYTIMILDCTIVKPNIWVMILGNSRITRKSHAWRYGLGIYNEVVGQNEILPNSGSPEGFMEAISEIREGDSAHWTRDEVGGFFRSLNKTYMEGFREDLSSLYSGIGFRRKLRKSEFVIPYNLFLTCFVNGPLPCSQYIRDEDFYGGFMNRFLVVYRKNRDKTIERHGRNNISQISGYENKIIGIFRDRIEKFSQFKEKIIISIIDNTIIDYLNDYEREIENDIKDLFEKNPNTLLINYLGQIPEFFDKLIILRRIARNPPEGDSTLLVEWEDVRKAKKDLDVFLDHARKMIEDVESTPISRTIKTEQKSLSLIETHVIKGGKDGIMWGDLLKKTNIERNLLRELICNLIEQGRIVAIRTDKKEKRKRGRKKIPLRFYDVNNDPGIDIVTTGFIQTTIQ